MATTSSSGMLSNSTSTQWLDPNAMKTYDPTKVTGTAEAVPTQTYDYSKAAVNQPTDTVQGQITGIIDQNSPLMQQARAEALQQQNNRGLLNSSMAVEAGQAALYKTALPIAQQDASTYSNFNLNNVNADNTAKQFNAQQGNAMGQFNASQQNTIALADADAANKAGAQNADSYNKGLLTNASLNQNTWSTQLQTDTQKEVAAANLAGQQAIAGAQIASSQAIASAQIKSAQLTAQAAHDTQLQTTLMNANSSYMTGVNAIRSDTTSYTGQPIQNPNGDGTLLTITMPDGSTSYVTDQQYAEIQFTGTFSSYMEGQGTIAGIENLGSIVPTYNGTMSYTAAPVKP